MPELWRNGQHRKSTPLSFVRWEANPNLPFDTQQLAVCLQHGFDMLPEVWLGLPRRKADIISRVNDGLRSCPILLPRPLSCAACQSETSFVDAAPCRTK